MSAVNSCQFLTSFETGSLDEMPLGAGDATFLSVQSSVKLHGSYALMCNKSADGGTYHYRSEGFTSNQTTIGIGFWVRIATRPASDFFALFGSVDFNGYVAIDSDGKLRLVDGGGNPQATSTQVLTNDTWYWISLKLIVATGITGELKIYNSSGTLLDTISDTWNKVSVAFTGVFVGTMSLNSLAVKYYLDSGYVSSGGHPPICPTVIGLLPDGTGTQGDAWVAEPAGTKYQKVDETPPNDITDYVHDDTGDVQSFTHADCGLAAGTNILAVKCLWRAATKTTDDILYTWVYDGTSIGGQTLAWATTAWAWQNRYLSYTKPSGGEWTIAAINAFESVAYYYIFIGDELRVSAVSYQVAYGVDPQATLTGTCVPTSTEAQIVSGGRTIIITLTGGETWVAAGATFDAQRQNIINGIDSAQSEAHGWDVEVKAKQGVAGVVRTSDTVVTITLDAQAAYDITATETITATIPATALTSGRACVASPTFTVTPVVLTAPAFMSYRAATGVGI